MVLLWQQEKRCQSFTHSSAGSELEPRERPAGWEGQSGHSSPPTPISRAGAEGNLCFLGNHVALPSGKERSQQVFPAGTGELRHGSTPLASPSPHAKIPLAQPAALRRPSGSPHHLQPHFPQASPGCEIPLAAIPVPSLEFLICSLRSSAKCFNVLAVPAGVGQ